MKRKLWLWIVVASIMLGGFCVWLILPDDPVTLGNCQKIAAGMTDREVETILGSQWRDSDFSSYLGPLPEYPRIVREWSGSRGKIIVYFSQRSIGGEPTAIVRPGGVWFQRSQSVFDRLRDDIVRQLGSWLAW